MRSATSPESSAATTPPAASSSWKNAQAARASSSVRDSTNHEPPAGSITRARCASMTSSDWVLRAIRRENGVDDPSAASNGATVTASAPPTPAAKPATVPRSRFTYGSRRVYIVGDATACTAGAGPAAVSRSAAARLQHPGPQAAGGAQLRDGRELLGGDREPQLQQAGGGVDAEPGGGERTQVGHAGRDDVAELLGVRPARGVHRQAVDDDGAHQREVPRHAQGERDDGPDVRARSGPGPDAHGVEAQRAEQRGRADAGGSQLQVRLRRGLRLGRGRGGVQDDRGEVEEHAVEGLRQVGDRGPGGTDGEPDRGGTVREIGENGLARIGVGVPGPHVPPVGDRPAGPASPRTNGRAPGTPASGSSAASSAV